MKDQLSQVCKTCLALDSAEHTVTNYADAYEAEAARPKPKRGISLGELFPYPDHREILLYWGNGIVAVLCTRRRVGQIPPKEIESTYRRAQRMKGILDKGGEQ